MLRIIAAGLLTVLGAIPASAMAAPPGLTGTMPLGVQRGKAMEVSLQGTGLDRPRLIAPFDFQLVDSASGPADASGWKVRMTVDARTPAGVYPIRVVTDEGPSNPVLFAVGQVEQVAEIEPNQTFAQAQSIPNPVVVEGECSGNDEDFFRFHGRRGERIVVDALCSRLGSGVDPMIRLTTGDRRFVASADDTPGLLTDAYLTAVLPEDGDYVLEFCDSRFAGTGRAVYRLLIGRVPFAQEVVPFALPRGQNVAIELCGGTLSINALFALRAPSEASLTMFTPKVPARLLGDPAWEDSELDVEFPLPVLLDESADVIEPADPSRKLPPLVPPVTVLGRLAKPGERDEFAITAPPGSKQEVRVEAWGLGSALDGQLRVTDADGRLIGEADDGKAGGRRRGGGGGVRRAGGPSSTDPAMDLTMPQGRREVRLRVKDLMDRGGAGFAYRLVVRPAEDSFRLVLEDDAVAIPRGGTALIPVTATRTGYNGPIALDVRGIPSACGVTVLPGTVPAGQNGGVVGLKAAADGPSGPLALQVIGRGDTGQAVAASGTTVFARQTISTPGFGMAGTIPSYSRPFSSVTAAAIRPGPIALDLEPGRIALPQGSTLEVPIRIARADKGEGEFKLAALSPPTGVSIAECQVGKGVSSVQLKVTAARDAAPGPVMIGLVAREKAAAVAAALIAVDVVQAAKPK